MLCALKVAIIWNLQESHSNLLMPQKTWYLVWKAIMCEYIICMVSYIIIYWLIVCISWVLIFIITSNVSNTEVKSDAQYFIGLLWMSVSHIFVVALATLICQLRSQVIKPPQALYVFYNSHFLNCTLYCFLLPFYYQLYLSYLWCLIYSASEHIKLWMTRFINVVNK